MNTDKLIKKLQKVEKMAGKPCRVFIEIDVSNVGVKDEDNNKLGSVGSIVKEVEYSGWMLNRVHLKGAVRK